MTIDISGYGTRINLVASNTYPIGVNITQFADDADPLDFPSIQIADAGMGLNGDLCPWSKAATLKLTANIIPSSVDDTTLSILLESNRVGQGKISAKDVITLTVIYPDNRFIILRKGIITDGMPGTGIASSGRFKTKPYMFLFENKIGTV